MRSSRPAVASGTMHVNSPTPLNTRSRASELFKEDVCCNLERIRSSRLVFMKQLKICNRTITNGFPYNDIYSWRISTESNITIFTNIT